jgi:succinylarginine dihydrolase
MHQGVILTDSLFHSLNDWVERHYRDRMSQADLADPQLLFESRSALDDLTRLTGVGSIYPFQR